MVATQYARSFRQPISGIKRPSTQGTCKGTHPRIAIYFVCTLRDDIFDATLGGSLHYPLMDILGCHVYPLVIIRPRSRLWNSSENR